jgi:putative ABC transport system permease protein
VKWYRWLLLVYPPPFRERFGRDLEELAADLYRTQAARQPCRQAARFWWRLTLDTLRHGLSERFSRRRQLPLRVHHARGPSIMALLVDDFRHALRAVQQHRALSVVVLLTMALAVGANSAIFTVVNSVLLRPLPYADPDRVVMLYMVNAAGADRLLSIPDFEDLRGMLTTVHGLSAMGTQTANLTGVAEPDRLRAGFVTADFFRMLGVQPVIGRAFAPGEDAPGAAKTALLDYDVWQTRFGGDVSLVGRALILNNEPHHVIGILPPRFEFPIAENDVWLPYSSSPVQDRERDSRYLMVFGRLDAAASGEQVAADLRQATAALALAYPETNSGWTARVEGIHVLGVMFVRRNLQLLMGAVAFVLLIACATIANLLLARAASRQREIAVRAALGASRARILRQLLAESVLLAVAGGAAGLVLGSALTDAMLAMLPTLPRSTFVRPDVNVVLFTAAVSIATGLLFGLVPALRLSRPDLRASLGEGGRGGESRETGRLRAALVVAELSLSLMLLTGAGLLIQSLHRLANVELGYDPGNLLTLEYRLPRNKYPQRDQQIVFHQRVLERIEAVPGVRAAAFAGAIPQSGNGSYIGLWPAGEAQPPREAMPRAQANVVSDDFFAVLGIPVFEGRVCGAADVPGAAQSVLVNRMLAERFWPGQHAIGKRLRGPDIAGEAVVIGVVGNTRPGLLSAPIVPQIYGCMSQQAGIFASIAIKTAGEPLALARAVQHAIWSVDPDQPMWKIRSAEMLVAGSVQRERFVMWLMVAAAALALFLAGLGTYTVLTYNVQRRAREMGLRLALGASRASIVLLVVGQSARLTAIGIVAGLAGAAAVSRVIATQLYEISARDPATFAAMAATLAVVALLAASLPVWRATRVDPVVTLRAE